MSREILMPQVASDMTEADVVAWLVEPGDPFEAGDVLLEIETEKSTVEIEAPAAGVLTEILVPAGKSNVAVGTLLAQFEESTEGTQSDPEAPDEKNVEAAPPPSAESLEADTTDSTEEDSAPPPPESRPPATALAKRIADRSGIDLEGLRGTGPHGRVTRDDVQRGNQDAGGLALREIAGDSHPGMQPIGSTLELTFQCRAEALVETMDRLDSISQGEAGGSAVGDIVLRAVEHAGLSVPAFFSGPGTADHEPQQSIRVITQLPAHPEAHHLSGADLLVVQLGDMGMDMVRWGPVSPQFPRILGVGSPREAPIARDGNIHCGQVLSLHLAVDSQIVAADAAAAWANAVRASIEAPLTLLL